MKATIYIELIPRFSTYHPDRLWEVRTGRTSTKEATAQKWGTRYTAVTLDVPAALFAMPKVEISVDIPEPVVTGSAEGS